MYVTILAVTRKVNDVCIAGVNDELKWIRPIKKPVLKLKDIKVKNRGYLSVSNVYDFSFTKHIPNAPQAEDYLMDEKKDIMHIKTLTESERKSLFLKLSENSLITSDLDIAAILKNNKRSLILLGPVTVESVYMRYEDKYMKSPRISCKIDSFLIKNQKGKSDISCTDLKFRAFAKDLLKKENKKDMLLTGVELKRSLGFSHVFIAIGLTRYFEPKKGNGDYWPMIIGFHTIPDYKQEIDYNDL